jgi:hypothetical protein
VLDNAVTMTSRISVFLYFCTKHCLYVHASFLRFLCHFLLGGQVCISLDSIESCVLAMIVECIYSIMLGSLCLEMEDVVETRMSFSHRQK